jgi:hypothetical protein
METPRPGVRAGTVAAILRARLARAHQLGHEAEIPELERQFWIETATDYITRLVDSAPPLTTEQLDQLASLFAKARVTTLEVLGGGRGAA